MKFRPIYARFKFLSPKGYSYSSSKEFNSQAHIDNYINVMSRNGYTLDELWPMQVVIMVDEEVVRDANGEISIYQNHGELNKSLDHLRGLGFKPKAIELAIYKTLKK